jgi:ClpP class serine protease
MAHQRILEYVLSSHWAILPEVLQTILCIAQGENESPEAVAAKLGRPLQNTRTVTHRDGVAVLPVGGPIFRYANVLTEISGATSVEVLATDFRAALDDPDIRGIVLEIDSPGGQSAGISEFADQVAAAGKPTVAYISDIGASAGYWIASAADQVIIRDTAVAGSVGVVATLRRDKKDDRIQIVSSQSPRKRVDPETEDGRAVLQAVVDDIADVFIGRVASYRGVSAEHVLAHFGQGGLLVGRNAVSAGMADGLGSLESIIAGLAGKSARGNTMRTKTEPATAAQPPVLDRETLAAAYPELLESIQEEGRAVGREEGRGMGFEDGWAKGIEAERGRIKAVKAVSLPGHEGLIERLMFDGTTTGPEAAVLVLAAENGKRTLHLKAIKDDAPPPVTHAVAPDLESAAASDTALPLEERCKRAWDRDPKLRAEFGDRYESYLAFTRAEEKGSVKILRRA